MRNRFEKKQPKAFSRLIRGIFFLAIPALIVLLYIGAQRLQTATRERQLEGLENAMSHAIIQCYAVEGFYPPDLDYLKTHYGIRYNESYYRIDYRPVGANILPKFEILPIGETEPSLSGTPLPFPGAEPRQKN